MTPETRKAVIAAVVKQEPANGSTLPEAIDAALGAAQAVLDARRDEHRELVEEERRHREAVAAIGVRAIEAKGKCRHWHKRPINGGPYDRSYSECSLCGQDLG